MSDVCQRYLDLIVKWREVDGDWPDDVDDELDGCWYEMTATERDDMRKRIGELNRASSL